MKLAFWNTNRGPSRPALEHLSTQSWDLAVLVEVGTSGWERLRKAFPHSISTIDLVPSNRTRFGAAVVSREDRVLEPHMPTMQFPPEMERYAERFLACRVTVGDQPWLVAGLHMPNAVKRGQVPKETVYGALVNWLELCSEQFPLVLGVDTNNSSGPWSVDKPVKPHMRMQSDFLRAVEAHGMHDAFLTHRRWTPGQPRPATHRTGPNEQYYDRILVSDDLEVNNVSIDADVCGWDTPGTRLSDHALVIAELSK